MKTTILRQLFVEGGRHKSENNGNNGPSVLENNGKNRTIHRPEGTGHT